MSCDPLDAFRYATEDLDQQVSRTASYRSVWMNVPERGTYPKGVGTNRSVFALGNVEPTTGSGNWTPIDLSNQLGTAGDATDTPAEVCTNNWQDVEWGFFETTYGPEMSQLRGPVICKKQLDYAHDIQTFMSGYVEEISKRAKREWELNIQYHHISLSRKAVATSDFDGTFVDQLGTPEEVDGLDCPSCELTQEMLESVAQYLIEDGATTPDSNGFITWEDNGPIFSLYIGMAQSQRILRQNSELRQDYRDSFSGLAEANPLIKRIGANRVIGNFRHVINQRPRRYTCSGGTYTLIQPYITATGGAAPAKGEAQIINPAWRAAPYEGADILSPFLFTHEVVMPTQTVAGQSLGPSNYMGRWQFVRGAYKWDTTCDDPLEEQARHYAQFVAAAKPNIAARFKYGYHIIWRRCVGASFECTSCSS